MMFIITTIVILAIWLILAFTDFSETVPGENDTAKKSVLKVLIVLIILFVLGLITVAVIDAGIRAAFGTLFDIFAGMFHNVS